MSRRLAFIEARDDKGLKYLIRVISAGVSINKNLYPDAVLRQATPLFEGVRVFVKPDEEHLRGGGKDFRNLIGRISRPAFIEGRAPDTGEVQAELDLLASAGDVAEKVREAYERNMADDLFGFSIDAEGTVKTRRGGIREAQTISHVKSLDLIIEPSAGGQILKLLEAVQPEEDPEVQLRERILAAVKTANNGSLPDGLDTNDDQALETAYREALASSHNPTQKRNPRTAEEGPSETGQAPGAVAVTQEQVAEQIRIVEARANMRVLISESKLPPVAKEKLTSQFAARDSFTDADVNAAIDDERKYLATFSEAGRVEGLGEPSRIEGGEDRAEKVRKMLDSFFDPKDRSVVSFKECYIEITGDRRVTGATHDIDWQRYREAAGPIALREAISAATFAEILGDSIRRRMVMEYNDAPARYSGWRMLTGNPVPLTDFRTNRRTRMGGYGSLPAVAENGAYAALTSPGDEEATYAASKRGGTETISLEATRNDDAGVVAAIPRALGRAAVRTLARFVFDFIATNPTIYDSVAFFHATHGNLGAAALDATTFAAARLAVLKQTEDGSSERLGLPIAHLWVPSDLEETAFDLFRRTTNNDTDFVESMQVQVHPVWYWTDANDWAATVDPMDAPIIEIGFLDGNEEPDVFVQDNPTQGSLFSNDQIKWKIRHIYGGAVVDYRGAYKAVVV